MSGEYSITAPGQLFTEEELTFVQESMRRSYFEEMFTSITGIPFYAYNTALKRDPESRSETILRNHILETVSNIKIPRGSHKYHLI